ncbi:Cullin family protein, putative [Phytophthora infestans T30-4]|uniref:Cullin family protein, putative n=1 Tax=Phytophthora infestans (strain T30-4) TaxID=403677 RepID=D0MX24_PHYIT|nr:Cullin family protein, putative [Phytophthora infestans T30-4]EEY64187.1 Cullin family protein, putative [Phytophthora infestans T30-4]|eukprot:XP_002907623.1 Cullin family protein, putative [Phytophthora infestans T30-4]
MSGKNMISLEEGWDQEIKPKAIDVLLDILDKGFDQVKVSPFPPNAFMPIYTTCYNMCTQRSPYNFSEQLYDRHGQTFDTYLEQKVLPSLEQAHDEFFLQELVKRWTNHKLMMKWMTRFFMYLDRYYVKHHSLPTLDDAGLQSFDRMVFQKVKVRVKDAMIELIEKERNGEIIDTTLMKNCVEIFEVMGMKSLDVYQSCLEADLVSTSAIYYERKSKGWLSEDSTPVVFVFSYLTDKDLFAEIYRNQLAKRLLNQRSASADAEVLMIGKLKLRCGAQFTGKMEGMMNDLAIGSDHHQEFEGFLKKQRESDSNEAALNLEFSVQVLTTGYWPSYRILEVTMPPLMVRCMNLFKVYYDSKTSHRRLQWVHSLGNATIRANFPKKKWYDLQVTTLQAVALLLFNEGEGALSFEAVHESLNVTVDVVKRIMHSLSCGKYKLLAKTPAGKTISTSDQFAVNKTFASPMRKLRIPMASLEESHSQKNVEEDRSIAIEAAIVRIMKARKTLQHQQLISEVLSQLAFFKPNLKVIKRRIEALIDREYLERDPDQANTYRYLA